MSSGAYVLVVNYGYFLNVYVYAVPEDKMKMSGLCGTFDGNPANDVINVNSWR